MSKKNHRYSLIIGITIAAIFLWLALKDTDLASIGRALAGADFVYAAPLLTLLAMFYWIKAIRWRMLLTHLHELSTRQILPAMMIGCLGNNVLPAHLGELVRVYLLGKQLDFSKSAILASVVLERLFDLLTVLLLLGLTLMNGGLLSATVERAGYFVSIISALMLLLLVAAVIWPDRCVAVLRKMIGFLPSNIENVFIRQAELAIQGLHSVRKPKVLMGIVVGSIAQWSVMAMCLYCSVLALNIDVPFSAAIILLAINVAGIVIPSSPGFFGTIQLCFVLALTPYQVNPSEAFAASVFYHLLAYVAVTLTGLMYLALSGTNLRRTTELAEIAEK